MKAKLGNKQSKWMQVLLLSILLLAFGAATTASAGADHGSNQPVKTNLGVEQTQTTPAYIDDQVVVRFNGSKIAKRILKDLEHAHVVAQLQFEATYLLQYDTSINEYDEAASLAAQRGVEYAHPNFVTDSSHGVQGSRPIGDPPGSGDYKGQPAEEMLDLDRVHPVATGDGVRIGIIDGGINFDHPLFDSMTFEGYDFVDEDDYAFDEPGGEISGHGTFVAGVLHLVAPDAELVPYRVVDACGHGNGFNMALAIERAVTDGCQLINLSIVLTGRHWAVRDAILYAEEQNVVVVVAAGNDSSGVDSYPAAERGALAVAAIDENYVLADFSNYGMNIDVCAPGVDLYSAYTDTIFAWWSGTSFAAPCVTGQLALLADIYPLITVEDFYTIIADNCIDLDPYNPGFEDSLGYGMINTYRALIAAGVAAIEDHNMPDDTTVTVNVDPIQIEAIGYPHSSFNIVELVIIESSNAPSVYKAVVMETNNPFTSLIFATGLTNGAVKAYISAADIYKTGVFINRIAIRVLGAPEVVFVEVRLTVINPPELAKVESDQPINLGVGNYPNPFNPSTTIYFGLQEASQVNLKVYDILGREVNCLVSRFMPAGEHQVEWNGTNSRGEQLASGMYFYRLQMGQQVQTRKMVLIK